MTNKDTLIFQAYRGSKLHHTDGINSDEDTIEVYMKPKQYYFSLLSLASHRKRSHAKMSEDEDSERHEFLKYVSILCKGNPNAIDYLFNQEWAFISTAWKQIIAHKNLFLSQHLLRATMGMVTADVRRLDRSPYPHKRMYACVLSLRKTQEVMINGETEVNNRSDLEELIALKTGQLKNPRALLDAELERFQAAEALHATNLRPQPAYDEVNELISGLMESTLIGGSHNVCI